MELAVEMRPNRPFEANLSKRASPRSLGRSMATFGVISR